MRKYHWYQSKEKPKADKVVSGHYGYKDEPPYEVIEKYDLRKVSFESLNELFKRYFLRSDTMQKALEILDKHIKLYTELGHVDTVYKLKLIRKEMLEALRS